MFYYRRRLWLVLFFSYAIRVFLCLHGGQYFWPDEARYGQARTAVYFAFHPREGSAFAELFSHADHFFFRIVAIPAALGEQIFGENPKLAACYFAAFSVLAIYLVARVAKRAGADDREAFSAAFLAALSSTLLEYSRHFFPYDSALCFILGALACSFGPTTLRKSFVVGVLASLGFLTYNGYWLVAGAVLTLYCTIGSRRWREVAVRGFVAGGGLIVPLVLVVLLGKLWHQDMIALFRAFSGTIVQGDFGVGYRVILDYLWFSDGWLLLIFLAGTGAGLLYWLRNPQRDRFIWWTAALLFLLVGLVGLSDVVPKFVVYGRLARCLVPFLCLAAAYGWEKVRGAADSKFYALVGHVAILAIAWTNFWPILTQTFPPEFRNLAKHEVASHRHSALEFFRVVRAEHLWGMNLSMSLPPHDVILRRKHPLQYRPNQYEGFSAEQRRAFKQNDISMRLIRLRPDANEPTRALLSEHPLWGIYPGPILLRVKFPRDHLGRSEPLVSSGQPTMADFLYVQYQDSEHVRIGFDHWGGGGPVSPSIPIDYAAEHELWISMGSLLPPPDAKVYSQKPGTVHLRSYLLVYLDGTEIFSSPAEFHPADPSDVSIASNFVGGSTAAMDFTGTILQVERLPWQKLEELFPPLVNAVENRDVTWNKAVGPLSFMLYPETLPTDAAQPLVSVESDSGNELLFVRRNADGQVQFGYDQPGANAIISDTLGVLSGPIRITYSTPAFIPGAESALIAANPHLLRLRELLFISVGDRSVFVVKQQPKAVARNVSFGVNTVGSTATRAYLHGKLKDISAADPSHILTASVELTGMTGSAGPLWDGYPGAVVLTVRFHDSAPGTREPLITSGNTGAGDFIYAKYESSGVVRLGFDHWGIGGGESEPLSIDPNKDYQLTVCMGALMPPLTSKVYRDQPSYALLKSVVWLELDKKRVLALPMECHATTKEQLTLGVNFIGGSTAGATFGGRIASVKRVPIDYILPLIRSEYFRAVNPPAANWMGRPGPLELETVFPEKPTVRREVILVTGKAGEGDIFFVQYDSPTSLRIGWDHWGAPETLSEPFTIKAGATYKVSVSVNGLFPPPDASLYNERPDVFALAQKTQVLINGKSALESSVRGYSSAADQIAVGANFIGGSAATLPFSGKIVRVSSADLDLFRH